MKTGRALFYSDAFVAANCKIDSVSIFIDNQYKGKLTNSCLPLSRIPEAGDANTFVSDLSAGDHVYVARISGCETGQWSGTFFVQASSCERIDLELLTLKP
ncbi:MAG TPA: hypothetical protein VFL76_02565 [Edaphocola sp.]|nr:hypothetical protein [Edaphocola sp.]